MGEPIKTISLDDLGDFGSDQTQPFPTTDLDDTFSKDFRSMGVDPLSQLSQATSTLNSELKTVPESFQLGTGTQAGTSATRLTQLFGTMAGSQGRRRRLLVVSVVLLGVSAAVLMLLGDIGSQIFEEFLGEEQVAVAPVNPRPADRMSKAELKSEIATEAAPPGELSSSDLQNPYWNLPNPLEMGPKLAPHGVITLTQEETWKGNLEGSTTLRYDTYLRFRTIEEMRERRLKGSESLYNTALRQPKFWARMEALFGLTELGAPPDVDTVQNAIGNTRRALVKNYFKRFRQDANPAELYILRQAIRVVDAGARLVILDVLSRHNESVHVYYYYAASFDPSPQVQIWYREKGAKFAISASQKEQFKRFASGQENPPGPLRTPDIVLPPKPSELNMQDLKVEELPHDVNVEEVFFLNEEETSQELPENAEVEAVDDGFDQIQN